MRAVLLMGLLSFLVACSSARGPEGNATEKTAPDFSKPFPLTRDLWGTPTYPSFVVVLESDLSPEDKARLQNSLGKTAFYDAQRKFYYIERHPENQWFKLHRQGAGYSAGRGCGWSGGHLGCWSECCRRGIPI